MRACFVILFLLASAEANTSKMTYTPENTYRTYNEFGNQFADLKIKDPSHLKFALEPYTRLGKLHYQWRFPPEGASQVHPIFGGLFYRPNAEIRFIDRTPDDLVYDAVYTTDQFSRRVTPLKKKPSQNKFLALLGCSVTFGLGLNDNQTLSYYIAQKSSDFYPYNYGVPGTSVNTALSIAEQPEFAAEIPESVGVFVYVYIEDHVVRASGIMPSLGWMLLGPYYDFDHDGRPVRNGFWQTARPYYSQFVKTIYSLFENNILKGRQFPLVTSSDYEHFCRMTVELRDKVLAAKPGSRFIFYRHVGAEIAPELQSCLERHNVSVYRGKTIQLENNAGFISNDGHPSAAGNQIIAQDILEAAKKDVEK